MGASSFVHQACRNKMKKFLCVAALVFAAMATGSEVWENEEFKSTIKAAFDVPEVSLVEDEVFPEDNLLAAAKNLRKTAQKHMSAAQQTATMHVDEINRHAELIQGQAGIDSDDESEKTTAYTHNFETSKAAIKSALKGLNDQLVQGHDHDKKALASAKTTGEKGVTDAAATGLSKTKEYKSKACPLKRAEEAADVVKANKKKHMDGIKAGKICPLSTTWGDMDVEKTVPKFGNELRQKWDATRVKYVKAKSEYDAAVKAHHDAVNAREAAMSAFKTATTVEASAVTNACANAHKEYNTLKTEVASNVASRKQVWVATLVVTCYVDNLTSNAGAKACADKARSADVSKWNIDGGSLAACKSKAHYETTFGPLSWYPTSGNCHTHPPAAPASGFSYTMHKASKNKEACLAMRKFRAGLSDNKTYKTVTVESVGKGKYTCSDPAAATKICHAVKVAKTREYAKVPCGGHMWVVGQWGAAEGKPAMEINVAVSNTGKVCQCQGNGFTLRPCIGHTNSNWGGWGQSCGGKVQQTMKIHCY